MSDPLPCPHALEAIEANPLELPEEVLAHLETCPACREARVLWLAQEEAAPVLVPAGYFERLPGRVLRQLPARRGNGTFRHPVLWLAAAGLALALGVGGYLAGRVQNAPAAEASLGRPPADLNEFVPETPFGASDDALSQLSDLSQEDAEQVLQQLESASRP